MKKKILLAEDESIVRLDVAVMLEEAGYSVIGEVGNGDEAIEFVSDTKPDLIIMDIKMPKLNGLKASKVISNKYHIPILLLTAYSQQDFVESAKEANVVGYVIKPVSEDRLIPAVEIALFQGEKQAQNRHQLNEVSQRLKERKIIEQAKGLLMDKLECSERTAYAKMRKVSMNRQVTVYKVAEHILKKYSNDYKRVTS